MPQLFHASSNTKPIAVCSSNEATTISTSYDSRRRPSTDTERHLLTSFDGFDSASIAPSDSISVISPYEAQTYNDSTEDLSNCDSTDEPDGTRTPRASSPNHLTRTTSAPQPYRGFPSFEAYIAALRAWAEDRQNVWADSTLNGFYGAKTMSEYAAQPPVMELRLGRKWRARRRERKMSAAAAAAASSHHPPPPRFSSPPSAAGGADDEQHNNVADLTSPIAGSGDRAMTRRGTVA